MKDKVTKEKKGMEIDIKKKKVHALKEDVDATERVISKKIKEVFKCAICDKQFSCKQNVKMHLESAHTVQKYVCKQCGKEYGRPQTLRGHVKTVHKGFRFKCTKKDCNEEFIWKDQLNVHMLEHEGKYKFICSICSKGYNHKGNFESHLNTHLGEMIYMCHRCKVWATNYHQDFKRHLKVCGVQPHIKCPIDDCGKLFKSETYVQAHLNNVHEQGDPFICPICGKKNQTCYNKKESHENTSSITKVLSVD